MNSIVLAVIVITDRYKDKIVLNSGLET